MSSVQHRIHALCPYFAMFPPTFVRKYLLALAHAGHVILDPFSGPGNPLLESLFLDRQALAVDINLVAACITGAKASVLHYQPSNHDFMNSSTTTEELAGN